MRLANKVLLSKFDGLLTDSLLPRRVVEVITGGQGKVPKLRENFEKTSFSFENVLKLTKINKVQIYSPFSSLIGVITFTLMKS